MDLVLRDLKTVADCQKVVELERIVWGYTDDLDITPVPILIITVKRGGILIGAFTPEGDMVGFVYSLPGIKDGKATQWSHMLGVADEYRRGGLGRRLKLAQRDRTIAMGLDLIEWTFDPMQAANAHLNLASLGAIVCEYAVNVYGDSSSLLHRGTPTDRFIAQWWVNDERVVERVSSSFRLEPQATNATKPTNAVAVNRLEPRDGGPACAAVNLDADAPQLLVTIPAGFSDMQQRDRALAREWRFATREIFTTYFGRGYRAVDFFLDRERQCGSYVLAKA